MNSTISRIPQRPKCQRLGTQMDQLDSWTIQPWTSQYRWPKSKNAFQDTGARERVEDKLQHLNWMPNEVDTFIAQFKSLAEEAGYLPNVQPMLTLFASKLPGSMVNHIYKVVRPQTFQDWADMAWQFHRDNIVVQNLRNISEDFGGCNKGGGKKGGMTTSQLAALLKVKLPLPDPNAMDTRANCSHSNWRNCGSKSWAVTTTEDNAEKWQKEGRCFTCNKQGHIARNYPNKKKKPQVKAHKAETEDSGVEGDESNMEDTTKSISAEEYVHLGETLKEEDKITIIRHAIIAEQAENPTSKQDF